MNNVGNDIFEQSLVMCDHNESIFFCLQGIYPVGYYLEGMLDEAALYNRALTAAEIQQHYNNGVAGRGIDYVAPGNGDDDNGGGGGGGGGCFIATTAR